jgi:hypothetical protein
MPLERRQSHLVLSLYPICRDPYFKAHSHDPYDRTPKPSEDIISCEGMAS